MKKNFKFALLLFGVGFWLVGSAAGISWASAGDRQAYVRVSKANVRKTPDKYSPRLFSLRRNSKVKVLKERDQWFYITTGSGRRGWIFKSLLKIVKAPKIEPEIEFFSIDLEPEQEVFLTSIVGRLRKQLAAVEKRQFAFVVSQIDSRVLVDSGSGAGSSWLLILRVPFSRTNYQEKKGEDLEVGTIDLLLYQDFLKVMLECRELMLVEIAGNPKIWSANGVSSESVKVLLVLKNENGDEVALGGFKDRGFPVFKDYLILDMHGFSQFSLRSVLPASVADFNKFVLPPPRLSDGSRTPAALAYDFFGFIY